MAAQCESLVVISDSGGVQEETTYLGVPCLTLRSNTERPITVTQGTNRLIGERTDSLVEEVHQAVTRRRSEPAALEYWDGHAAERIVDVLLDQVK